MTDRINRLSAEPWLAEVTDIVTLAAQQGVTLSPRDIKGASGDYTIDGMEWYEWLTAMTEEKSSANTVRWIQTDGPKVGQIQTKTFPQEIYARQHREQIELYVNTYLVNEDGTAQE